MCGVRSFDRKTRMLYSGGMLCIVAALLIQNFEEAWRRTHPELFDGFRGFLSGIGIGLLLWVLWRRRCCTNSDGMKS